MTSDKNVDKRLLVMLALAQVLSQSTNFDDSVKHILKAICEKLGWEFSALWLLDPSSNLLRCHSVWHDPNINVDTFVKTTQATTFSPGSGLPGRVWKNIAPDWISDVVVDQNFPRRTVAKEVGLHGAFAFPIFIQKEMLGVIECLCTRVEEPDLIFLEVISALGAQIGQFFMRMQVEESDGFDGILTLNQDTTIVACSPRIRTMFGFASNEMIGKDILEFIPNYGICATSKQRNNDDLFAAHKDGHTFPIELSISSIDTEKGQTFAVIVRDITERKKIEALKNEFISTVSHELRTPLTSIRGSLGLIIAGVSGEMSEKAKNLIDIAYKNTERLILLINDILDIEKIESDQMRFDFTWNNTKDLVNQAIELNRGYSEKYNVKYEVAQPIIDAEIYVDKDRLMQVITNLLSNATKYSPAGGRVEIATSLHNEFVRFSITDHGPGIPANFQPHIFGKFAQADSSTTKQKGGSGLGLNISKVIIERFGGKINFVTEEDKGTTFYFDLPKVPKAEVTPSKNVSHAKRRILICEDDPDIAHLLKMMLNEHDMMVDISYSAAQAKSLLNTYHYDALTLDLGLPDQNGIQLIQELRQKEKTKNIPIVVISANAEQGSKTINGHAFGILDWMTKPIDPSRLIEVIKQIPTQSTIPNILYVEDDADLVQIVTYSLTDVAEVVSATTLAQAEKYLAEKDIDLILLDVTLPDGSGLKLLEKASLVKNKPVIIYSGTEVSEDVSKNVSAALVKSRTSETAIVDTIKALISEQPAQRM